jgi:hypothetical protein
MLGSGIPCARTSETDENGNQLDQSEWIRSFQNENLWEPDLNWDKTVPQVLLRGVKSLTFSYWDQRTEKFVERLQDSSDPDVLRAIKIDLVWINSDGNEQEFVKVVRPIWPFFDTKKDEEQKEIFRKQQNTNQGVTQGQDEQ